MFRDFRYTLTRADESVPVGSAERISSRFPSTSEEKTPLAFVFGWAGASARN